MEDSFLCGTVLVTTEPLVASTSVHQINHMPETDNPKYFYLYLELP